MNFFILISVIELKNEQHSHYYFSNSNTWYEVSPIVCYTSSGSENHILLISKANFKKAALAAILDESEARRAYSMAIRPASGR